MEKARRTALSAALFALICFFLPWAQASCLGASGRRDLSLYLWMEICMYVGR
jgi:hypothetical protein